MTCIAPLSPLVFRDALFIIPWKISRQDRLSATIRLRFLFCSKRYCVRANRSSLTISGTGSRIGVKFKLELSDITEVDSDKQRGLYFLFNLYSNCMYALFKSQKRERSRTLRCCRHGDNGLRIEASDKSVEISQEKLTKKFRPGLATKQDGRGLGMHGGIPDR